MLAVAPRHSKAQIMGIPVEGGTATIEPCHSLSLVISYYYERTIRTACLYIIVENHSDLQLCVLYLLMPCMCTESHTQITLIRSTECSLTNMNKQTVLIAHIVTYYTIYTTKLYNNIS